MKYYDKRTTKDIDKFIKFISTQLINTGNPFLIKTGNTYINWLPKITNSLLAEVRDAKITNGVAEGFNNKVKTVIKQAYGFVNFERFRKRLLMILRYIKK